MGKSVRRLQKGKKERSGIMRERRKIEKRKVRHKGEGKTEHREQQMSIRENRVSLSCLNSYVVTELNHLAR